MLLLFLPVITFPPQDNAMGEGRDVWEHGPPPRKMRRMEWVSYCMGVLLGSIRDGVPIRMCLSVFSSKVVSFGHL